MYFFDQKTKIPPVKRAINIPRTSLQQRVGIYKIVSKQDGIKPGSVIKIVLDNNQLRAQLSGTPWIDIFPESQTTFYTKQGQIIAFKDSASHKSAILNVHYPGGFDLSARKLKQFRNAPCYTL